MRRLFLILLTCTAAVTTTATAAEFVTVQIIPPDNGSGEKVRTFLVETAETAAQRRVGLSGRHTLAADGGMLFVFRPPKAQVCMWMHNTHIPLAAVFAGAGQRILTVAFMQPRSKQLHCSGTAQTPVHYVLEVPADAARGVPAGSHLRLPAAVP